MDLLNLVDSSVRGNPDGDVDYWVENDVLNVAFVYDETGETITGKWQLVPIDD